MDHRLAAAAKGCWYEDLDEKKMLATVLIENEEGDEEEVDIPVKFEVCPTCNGKGRHVNPSIDAHGITMDEWDQWSPDEQEQYIHGGYDVDCFECGGNRVVAVPNKTRMSKKQCEAMEFVQEVKRMRIEDYRTYRMENGEYD